MMKMGWTPGKGLGVNEDGKTKHVLVQVKNDKLGVGVEPTSDNWLSASHEYDEALGSLATLTNVPRSDPETEPTDEKEQKSKKRKKDKKKKKKQTEIIKEKEPEIKLEKQQQSPKKAHNHFIPTKVRRGKEVSNYSQDDLSAIFGFRGENYEKIYETQNFEVSATKIDEKAEILTTTNKTPIHLYFSQKLASKNEKDVGHQPNTKKKETE